MAIDPANLTQTELLQLVNGTPLGSVLTRSRLRRQMDAAAFRMGDGTRIHLVKYVRWLVREAAKPRPKPIDYAEAAPPRPWGTRTPYGPKMGASPGSPECSTTVGLASGGQVSRP
jgi:hypothetical protein